MTTRGGGVSSGPYASLNLGGKTGDDPARVAENRRRVGDALALPADPRWLSQIHGTRVVRLRGSVADAEVADAGFTADAGIVCAVLSADCLPVLFCDEGGTVIAAAHAGWRGLAAGVLEATVGALAVPPGRLMAWFGAAIGPNAFEVGAEVRDAFVSRDAAAELHFKPSQPGNRHQRGRGSYLADLYGLARLRLALAGVTRTYGGGRCTYSEPGTFFSYRRDGETGRMAALIWRA